MLTIIWQCQVVTDFQSAKVEISVKYACNLLPKTFLGDFILYFANKGNESLESEVNLQSRPTSRRKQWNSDPSLWLPQNLFSYYHLVKVAQSCLTLWNPTGSLPGSSVHGILHARVQEWIAVPFSRGSSQSRDWTQVSCIAGGFVIIWATRKALLLYKVVWHKFLKCPIFLRRLNLRAILRACSQSLNHVGLFVTPWAIVRQAPLSMGFSQQEYWNRLPFPPPGHLPAPGIKPVSPTSPVLAGGSPTSPVLAGGSPMSPVLAGGSPTSPVLAGGFFTSEPPIICLFQLHWGLEAQKFWLKHRDNNNKKQ